MKKTFFVLIAAICGASAKGQMTDSTSVSRIHNTPQYSTDNYLGRWTLDINALGGVANQIFTIQNTDANYPGDLNTNTGTLKFKNAYSIGAQGQIGVFFGKKRHWGVGTGVMYMQEFGDAVLNNFHVEYQATDRNGNVYRQLVTGHDVREEITASNLNIPVVLKYRNRFSKKWGFAAEGGALINLLMKNNYTTHASFDYEAVYKLVNTEGGGTVSVYDNAPTPSANDWFITRAEFLRNNPNGDVNAYFNAKRALGYNVGENINAGRGNGNMSYNSGSVGFILKPSMQLFLSDNAALDFGLYYIYQPFKSNAQTGYRLINDAGNYNSSLNNVSSSVNQMLGVTVGARFFLARKDRDHDGVPDKKDKCPDVFGEKKFQGCPDTDGDGIPDPEDSCVTVPGPAKFHGCPDTDGDGIPDKDDLCPNNPGPVALHGCPDRDGDGIPDKDDLCPDQPGLPQFQGCPDKDGDGIPDKDDRCPDVAGPASNQGCPVDTVKTETFNGNTPAEPDHIDISTPILFDLNKATIHHSSYPVLEEAANEMKEDKSKTIVIDGYTDITGPLWFNKVLSVKRANAVKTHLVKMGVSPRRLKTYGHGPSNPIDDNSTPEGRHHNRRAVMKMKP